MSKPISTNIHIGLKIGGRPATNVGGTKEIVINDITGELISPNSSPNELSNAIKKILLMNKNDYNELRLKTRFFWESNFSTDNYIKFMNDIKLIK